MLIVRIHLPKWTISRMPNTQISRIHLPKCFLPKLLSRMDIYRNFYFPKCLHFPIFFLNEKWTRFRHIGIAAIIQNGSHKTSIFNQKLKFLIKLAAQYHRFQWGKYKSKFGVLSFGRANGFGGNKFGGFGQTDSGKMTGN